ncbi:PHP domain-containing protein [Catenovulum sp. SM1970]|uniref:RNase RNM n=1 Tax=Marinifaba aquimaris TaxID=2741323 RepID=UPI0015719D02|nr:PHP domain-containing protein [Marinifaba aquimaris]NTS76128.1 PHP domain-containing protein [Marinifaba aquimaris]
MKIDLHSHTNCSDGELTPKELVHRANNLQVDVLAITDHDSVEGLNLAHQAIAQDNLKVKLINGVEISTAWHSFEVHIVGLNIDKDCPQLQSRLASQLATRRNRAERIAAKLAKVGVEGALEGAKKLAKGQSLSRVHFAKYLINKGVVSDFDAAFKKYLARKAKAYVAPGWITIEQAVQWIDEAGGQAVLAHPSRYDLSNKWIRKLIDEFKAAGGKGIEVSLPRQSPNERQQLAKYAIDNQLLASQGSDFHRISRFSELGRNIQLPEKVTPIWHDWALNEDMV